MTGTKHRYQVTEAAEEVARLIAPALEERLRHVYGPEWLAVVNDQRSQDGYEPGDGLHDEQFCLAVFAYNTAMVGWAPDRERRMAIQLRGLANKAAHNDLLTSKDCDRAVEIAAAFRANYGTTPEEPPEDPPDADSSAPQRPPLPPRLPPPPPPLRTPRLPRAQPRGVALIIAGAALAGVVGLALLSTLDQPDTITVPTTTPLPPITTVPPPPPATTMPPPPPPTTTTPAPLSTTVPMPPQTTTTPAPPPPTTLPPPPPPTTGPWGLRNTGA